MAARSAPKPTTYSPEGNHATLPNEPFIGTTRRTPYMPSDLAILDAEGVRAKDVNPYEYPYEATHLTKDDRREPATKSTPTD